MSFFCSHSWQCAPQGHKDGYAVSMFCLLCGSEYREATGACAVDHDVLEYLVEDIDTA